MFNNIEYLIYSSHKTSTQSLMSIFKKNKIKIELYHNISNIPLLYPKISPINNIGCKEYYGWGENDINQKNILKKFVLDNIHKYNNNKKLSIISVIRNPIERLLSSFFQSYHNDEMSYHNIKADNTTIQKLNVLELYDLYCKKIDDDSLQGNIESLDEMSFLFDIDIINNLEKKENYYYFENESIKLYVLKFEHVINNNNLIYLNKILNIKLILNSKNNLSLNKQYYNKYNELKKLIGEDIKNKIYKKYDKFYFLK